MDRIGVSFLDPLDDYELIHRIGCGTYGDVFKVSENLSPRLHRADREKAFIRTRRFEGRWGCHFLSSR